LNNIYGDSILRVPALRGFLVDYYLAHLTHNLEPKTLLLLGPPGIGKSTAVREAGELIARSLGREFIVYSDNVAERILSSPSKYFVFVDLRLTEVEPTDLIGIPRDYKNYVMFKPLLWAYVLSQVPGILFLDEFTNIQRPDVQSIAFKIVYDRMAGFLKFRKDVLIIAAGNSPEYSSLASAQPAPLINRLLILEIMTPTVDDWYKWMNETYGDKWEKAVYVYLKAYQDDFISIPEDEESLENFPTPRSWTGLALTLKIISIKDKTMLREIIKGYLGKAVGNKFYEFYTAGLAMAKDILENPTILLNYRDNIDNVYASTLALSYHIANMKMREVMGKWKKIVRVMKILNDNFGAEMLIMFLRLILESNVGFIVLAMLVKELPSICEKVELLLREL